jgi:hypothetical protein
MSTLFPKALHYDFGPADGTSKYVFTANAMATSSTGSSACRIFMGSDFFLLMEYVVVLT